MHMTTSQLGATLGSMEVKQQAFFKFPPQAMFTVLLRSGEKNYNLQVMCENIFERHTVRGFQ